MKLLPLIFTLFISGNLLAQKDGDNLTNADYKGLCTSYFNKVKLNGENNVATVSEYLKNTLPNLKSSEVGLKLNYVNQSPGGLHYSFTQTYQGVEVYQSEIKVNTDNHNIIHSIFDNSFNTLNWNIDVTNANQNSVIAMLPETKGFVLATKHNDQHYEVLRYNNQVIFQRDMNMYFNQDSAVTGTVFRPDPLTSSQQFYTQGTFYDNNDQNAVWLTNALQTVTFNATFTGSEFQLKNDYVEIVDVDSPNVLPAVSASPLFSYNRSETGFEDVNAYYHINQYRDHVNALGYTIANHLVHADTHAVGGDDQSYFSPTFPAPGLYYGTGGVDDAEDADVVTHEYGHFLSYNASPGSNSGFQRLALDEAFGDYVAASYSKAISNFNSDWVFNWDGHNEFWSGRVVNSTRNYPADANGSIYHTGEIWSSAIMALHDEIGRNATDSLMYELLYNVSINISLADAAQLLIDADSTLNNGAYYCPIYRHLFARGLVPFYAGNPCGVSAINDIRSVPVTFQQTGLQFTIINTDNIPMQLTISNMQGQQLTAVSNIHGNYQYSNNNLPNGVYLVEVKTNNSQQSFKWVKAN